MKHWRETGQIVARLVRHGRQGRSCALATVVRIEGSAYRRPGAKMLIEDDGTRLGGVSGGCLEEDVRRVGRQVIESGRARLLHYATGEDESKVWGLGLGCNGEVDVLVQPVRPAAATGTWARVLELLEGDAPFALSTLAEDGGPAGTLVVTASGRLAGELEGADAETTARVEASSSAALTLRRSACQAIASHTVFTEVLAPPPKLLVCGAGDDARPLVAFAAAAGFRVCVADPRGAYATAERFPEAHRVLKVHPEEAQDVPSDRETYAVVMTHSLKRDTAWVKRLHGTAVPYIGLLGPRERTRSIREELGIAGSERIFGPVGLDLGADGPEQVALSIVAELLSVWSGREPRHLRLREEAVHARG